MTHIIAAPSLGQDGRASSCPSLHLRKARRAGALYIIPRSASTAASRRRLSGTGLYRWSIRGHWKDDIAKNYDKFVPTPLGSRGRAQVKAR